MNTKKFKPPEILKEYKGDCLKDLPLAINEMKEVEPREEATLAMSSMHSARYNNYLLPRFYKHISKIF